MQIRNPQNRWRNTLEVSKGDTVAEYVEILDAASQKEDLVPLSVKLHVGL